MPTKHRASKGRTLRVAKTTRKETTLSERAQAAILVETGYSEKEAAKAVGTIKPGAVGKIHRRAAAHAKEHRLPLSDISNFQDAPQPGQPRKLSDKQCDEICEWIIMGKEHRDMQAWEVIAKLRLDISDSLLFQLMYDRDYSRKKHG